MIYNYLSIRYIDIGSEFDIYISFMIRKLYWLWLSKNPKISYSQLLNQELFYSQLHRQDVMMAMEEKTQALLASQETVQVRQLRN